MKKMFDDVSSRCSKLTTRSYSTSFSLGINFLHTRFHDPIYAIYGFVRFADEIVDSFHGYDKQKLLEKFQKDTYESLEERISLNPILNSFQATVHKYKIEKELIDSFLKSMSMDLERKEFNSNLFNEYVLGSAEVVGLMCLRVFTEGDEACYQRLKYSAMKLGAAFQKVNFLRDIKADFEGLGRAYFPDIDPAHFSSEDKRFIEIEISKDFDEALVGIKELPKGARQGVYLAYIYYKALFLKIQRIPAERVMQERIRIPDPVKISLMLESVVRHKMNVL
jgi:15-cis-phytoene synthase